MKSLVIPLLGVICFLFSGFALQAQYKGPRDYFPKNYPAPAPRGAQPAAPRPADNQPPGKPQQLKFKDLPVNSQFYFASDTNHTYAWTKISVTAAKNTRNDVTQTISGEAAVQK